MFIVCFGDGLGNQMFQYAFYKALQKAYPENEVKMDIFRMYGKYIHNGFELSTIFGIQRNECNLGEAIALADNFPKHKKKFYLLNKLCYLRKLFLGSKKSHIIEDDPSAFYSEVFSLSTLESYIFCGNWVNEKYFRECKEELISEFTFPNLDTEKNKVYASEIENSESVSVHIRKGDYVNSQMINLPVEYYCRAKEKIEQNVVSPKYYIFTDDKSAIMDYLEIFDDYVIIEGNCGSNSYRDMQLMSLCKHNIIANSTFSFWGAYLNKNKNKIVIAPNKAKLNFRNPFACEDWMIIPYNGEK